MSDDIQQAKERAVAYIGISRNRTSGKIREKLTRDGYGGDTIDEVLHYLRSIDYLDDRRAAEYVLATYRGRKGRSRAMLRVTLTGRGVPSEVVDGVLDDGPSDEERATDLISACFPRGAEREAIYKRLLSRGFNPNLAASLSRKFAVTDNFE